jgi:AraC-like DNA-binding protein
MTKLLSKPIESPLESIAGIWKFEKEGMRNTKAMSTPGHLIHFYKKGKATVKVKDGKYDIETGDVFHYFDSEEVINFSKEKLIFYSVSFNAADLPPPSPETRKFSPGKNLEKDFDFLYELSLLPESPRKSLAIHSCFSYILFELDKTSQWFQGKTKSKWDEIENKALKEKRFRPSLNELAMLGGISRAGLVRACRETCGKSPMQRIREIRMAEAGKLLKHTQMNISQTADYLGYPRVHEFSREFSKFFGYPPTRLKKKIL